MPYPLENLPYGLRRRLRELVTPAETYALQTAAPNYLGLQPIQKMRPVSHVGFKVDEEGKIQQYFYDAVLQPIKTDKTILYRVLTELTLVDVTLNYKLSMFVDNFRLEPIKLWFYDCILNTGFVKNFLSSLRSPIELLDLDRLTTSKTAVRAICHSPAFKTLKYFTIKEPAFPTSCFWIEAFMEAKCTSLKEMYILNASLSVLQIDKDLFLNFFKAQGETFCIWFSMCEGTDWDKTIKLRNELFDEHFKITDKEEIQTSLVNKKCVVLWFGDISWYYTLRAV